MPENNANPLAVEVMRGSMVESRHRGSAVIADADGTIVAVWGDGESPVYPRSAVKPLQAIPLVESGAVDAYHLSTAELAVACASHGGEPRHVETVTALLERLGLSTQDLECGSQWPSDEEAARALAVQGGQPGAVHNNCSGKHTGFLATARHLGEKTQGYGRLDHPVQQRILGILEQMCGLNLGTAARGTDGCSIPTWAIPLKNLAVAMAHFAAPEDLPPARAEAVRRITAAMTAEPFMVAGTNRYCTDMMTILAGRAVIKTGAEGVFCAALPDYGLGVALKCDDGTTRASQVMMSALLRHIGVFEGLDPVALAPFITPELRNRNNLKVGEIRPVETFAAR
jgi:L-asparaginase II